MLGKPHRINQRIEMLPPALNTRLRPFQQEDLKWTCALKHHGCQLCK